MTVAIILEMFKSHSAMSLYTDVLGCYNDNTSNPDLPVLSSTISWNEITLLNCRDFCASEVLSMRSNDDCFTLYNS